MTRNLIAAIAVLALGACSGAALGGCGSSATKTVSAEGAPAVTHGTATATTSTSATPPATTTSTATTPAPAGTVGGAAAPTTTRTAPEPAFTHEQARAEGLSEAVATLQAHGYAAQQTSQYHPNQTLRVLVGTSVSSGEDHPQQAFFFVGNRYIGTDTKQPSASVKVLSQSDTEVTLAYPLYRPGDPLSSPSGGLATVRFQLNDGKLTPLDPIPPANSSSAPSRN
jgi:uncharacterized protein YceK